MGIFQGGILVPEALVALAWRAPLPRARQMLAAFEDCALLRYEPDQAAWQLRGIQVHFTEGLLRAQGSYAVAHERMLERVAEGLGVSADLSAEGSAEGSVARAWWGVDTEAPVGRYLVAHILRHLREAGLREEEKALLMEPRWLVVRHPTHSRHSHTLSQRRLQQSFLS